MAAEQGGQGDDFSHMPSMSSKTRELGKLQDMYRRTLAASWAAQDGELPADECVEDIFAGGDGWGKTRKDGKKAPKPSGGGSDSEKSEGTRRTRKTHHRNTSGSDAKHTNNRSKGHSRTSSRSNTSSRTSGINGRVSAEQQVQSSSSDTPAYNWRRTDELDELTAREDLRTPSTFSTAMAVLQNLDYPKFIEVSGFADVTIRNIRVVSRSRYCGQEDRGID
ncbi:MAG: hypothetical protein LQ338_005614 [Usnochroma carphineum]|nr:MAG: hypothetical protein LQ338_005614 [Usnochroma carphineum]